MKREEFEQKRDLSIRRHDYQVSLFNKLLEITSNDENSMFDLEELIKKYSGEVLKCTERSGHASFKWEKEEHII